MTRPKAGGTRDAVDRWFALIGALVLAISAGCNRSKSASGSAPDQRSTEARADGGDLSALESKPALLCSAPKDGSVFTLGTDMGGEDEDDSGVDIPFGINVGQAMGFDYGFAVAAIDGRAGKSHAMLAVFGQDGQNGKKLDLGRVYGDADPPHLAGDSRNLVIALADMDAAGKTLRLLRVDDPSGAAKVTKGEEISVAEDFATTFSVAATGNHGIVAWEQTDRKTGLGQVVFSHFLVQRLSLAKKPTVASNPKADAEAPQVLARKGGFWLGWIRSVESKSVERNARTSQGKSNASEDKSSLSQEPVLPAVDLGLREIYVSTLDAEGTTVSKALRVTDGPCHAVTYEMGELDDSSLILSWRDDDTSPGVESQVLHVTRVGLDGHIERFRIEDESIGVGEPQLLVDPMAEPQDRAWLAIGNIGEKLSLVRLQPSGNPTLPIVDDVGWGVANPLVRYAGILLVARQHGKSVDFEAQRCKFGQR